MTRDWTKTLPNASFRGVPFFIETESLSDSGRFVAEHDFVKSEDHDTEDMGRKPRKYQLSAYIVGDTADSDALNLVAACETPGDGDLVLPLNGYVTVKCPSCRTSGQKTAFGYIHFDLEFIESGNGSAFTVTAIGDRLASNVLDTLGAAVFDTLDAFTG